MKAKADKVNDLLEEIEHLKDKIDEVRTQFIDISIINYVYNNKISILSVIPKLSTIHLLKAHQCRIHDIVWSPKGDHLLSVGSDSSVIIWDAIKGLIYNLIDCSSQQPITVDITDNLDTLFVGGLCANATLFHMKQDRNEMYESYIVKTIFEHKSNVSYLKHFGDELLTIDETETVNFWDVENVKVKHDFTHRATITSFEVINPPNVILTGGSDGLVKLWDRRAKLSLQTIFEGHESDVTCLSVASNNKTFFSGSDDTFIHMYDTRLDVPLVRYGSAVWRDVDTSKEAIEHGDKPLPSSVCSLVASPSARILYAGCKDSNIYVWDSFSPADPIRCFDEQGPVTKLVLNPGKSGMGIVTWDVKNKLRILRPQK